MCAVQSDVVNEGALIDRAMQGDVDAFNRLIIEYQQLAYNVAYRILGNRDRAMDAWNRSLELDSNQPDLLRLVRKYTPAPTLPQL